MDYITTAIIAALFMYVFYRLSSVERRNHDSFVALYKELHEINLHVRGSLEVAEHRVEQMQKSKVVRKPREDDGFSGGYKMLRDMKPEADVVADGFGAIKEGTITR